MAPSFDCVVSSLLCAEDNAIFDDEEYGPQSTLYHHRNHRSHDNINQSFVNGDLSPLLSDEVLGSMVENECHHLPALDYSKRLKTGDLDFASRNLAVDWIIKANAHFGFGPLCLYLSINYLDRFLSAYELPKGKSWTMQLLAVACLSLAAKMEETEVPLCLELQVGDSKYVFEARTIQRMELLVLSTLKWRMKSITPFNFIDHFIHKLINNHTNHDDDDDHDKIPLIGASILRSAQLILGMVKEIELLEFKPSEIAAAVAIISVALETKTVEDIDKAIPLLLIQPHIEKERIVKCVQLVHGTALNNNNGSVVLGLVEIKSVPQSPIGVLEATACLSYKSDDTTTLGSCANSSSSDTHNNKRRKLNRPFEVEL